MERWYGCSWECVVGRKIHRKYPYTGLVVKPGLVPNHTTLLNFLNSCYKPNSLTNYKKTKKFLSHFALLVPLRHSSYVLCLNKFCVPDTDWGSRKFINLSPLLIKTSWRGNALCIFGLSSEYLYQCRVNSCWPLPRSLPWWWYFREECIELVCRTVLVEFLHSLEFRVSFPRMWTVVAKLFN